KHSGFVAEFRVAEEAGRTARAVKAAARHSQPASGKQRIGDYAEVGTDATQLKDAVCSTPQSRTPDLGETSLQFCAGARLAQSGQAADNHALAGPDNPHRETRKAD